MNPIGICLKADGMRLIPTGLLFFVIIRFLPIVNAYGILWIETSCGIIILIVIRGQGKAVHGNKAEPLPLLGNFDLVNQLLCHFYRCVASHFSLSGEDETMLEHRRRDKLDVLRCDEVTSPQQGEGFGCLENGDRCRATLPDEARLLLSLLHNLRDICNKVRSTMTRSMIERNCNSLSRVMTGFTSFSFTNCALFLVAFQNAPPHPQMDNPCIFIRKRSTEPQQRSPPAPQDSVARMV